MAAITTDDQLTAEVGKIAGAPLPAVQPTLTTVLPGEDIAPATGQVPTLAPLAPTQAAEAGLTPATPTAPAADVGQVAGITGITPGLEELGPAQAAQLAPTGPYVDMTGVEGTVSPGAMAEAAQAELDPRATVQYQLGEIMSSLESGGPMPAWAAPQVRKVNAIMPAGVDTPWSSSRVSAASQRRSHGAVTRQSAGPCLPGASGCEEESFPLSNSPGAM